MTSTGMLATLLALMTTLSTLHAPLVRKQVGLGPQARLCRVGAGACDSPRGGSNNHARLASVESRVEAKKLATPDPRAALRADLERELAFIDWKREGVKAPFEILAVLTDAESSAGKDGAAASCVVQVVLREPSGALLGAVSGRASGKDQKNARASLELGVLEAAAKSASAAIPEAVRRSRNAR